MNARPLGFTLAKLSPHPYALAAFFVAAMTLAVLRFAKLLD